MRTPLKNKLIERIDQLLKKAEMVKATHKPNPPNVVGFPTLSSTAFYEWKSSVENLILNIVGENSSYYKNLRNQVKDRHIDHMDSGIGILNALKEDLELGFLDEIKDLVIAEVFTDFLEIADHLLENGYKDPSASLVGAVLEDGLRRIADKAGVQVKNGDDIGSLNSKLADAGIYNRLKQKQIQAWKAIRNSADHGNFNDYTSNDVKDMLSGISRFLDENI